ncbi:MAG TPA: hypothetical protein VG841_10930 [Caulobacterales bacterium]|nr:hypothetical protein [Caulobacterales bacterium]
MKGLMAAALAALAVICAPARAQTPAHGQYQNFRVAIYVVVGTTRRLADRAEFDREFDRVWRQVHFDKVYLEPYRDHQFATDEEVAAVKSYFEARGIEVDGGVTLAAGQTGGQFNTFDYENQSDMAECRRAIELAARHFDHIILDDFFFYNTKSEADIVARGDRSWTQYRLARMRQVAHECVLDPARRVNPHARVIIKYPNWYEHFQGSGFDLEQEPRMFDGIYTGTETRDPYVTDQLLQQYESYEIIRYFDNIRPDGGNGGGWVDTYSTQYVDRYAEQLWDTLFAKAPEITLFNWVPMADEHAVQPGAREAWASRPTSFNWNDMVRSYRSAGPGDPGPGWGRAAGYSLEQVDRVLGALGHPIGVMSYKPYHSSGEDFLQNYLGNVGIPIEMTPTYPADAPVVLLTQQAAADPQIIVRIDRSLRDGHNVVITSGLLRALQGRGFDRIAEIDVTENSAAIDRYLDGYGAGNGTSLNTVGAHDPAVLFPELHFYTNDAWPVLRGVAGAKGFPVMLMNRYGRGVLYVLNIPENVSDLYNLPRPLLTRIRQLVSGDFPVRLDAPPLVSIFAYDNGTFVVQSFRDALAEVKVAVLGEGLTLTNVASSQAVAADPPVSHPANWRSVPEPARTTFTIHLEPHSFAAFRYGR